MELHWHNVECSRDGETLGKEGNGIVARDEDRVWPAFETGPDVCAQIVDRADEVLVVAEEVNNEHTPDNSEEPGAEEALPCLLGRDLNEGCPSKRDTAEVGKDVVGDDHGHGENEPDKSLKDVVDDKVRLSNDEEKGHVRPSKLGELELVVALLERTNEEDEAWDMLVVVLTIWLVLCLVQQKTHP